MPYVKPMKKRDESGFALLLVFVMAATVGIFLYKELPRLVFESQRLKEQDLVYRGEQYKRAIQLYVRKFKKYPASLDDLETSSDVRFLRRRYSDPLTGEDEWRLIHIDGAGRYTDSLIHKQKEEEEEESTNTFITEGAAFGSTEPPPGSEGAQGGAAVRGASDRPAAQAGQFFGTSPVQGQPVIPGTTAMPGAPGQPYPNQPYGQQPGQVPYGQQPGQVPYTQQPGQVPYGQPGQQPFGQPGQVPYPQQAAGPTAPGYPPNPNPNAVPGQSPTSPYVQPGQQQYPSQGVPGLPGPFGQSQQPGAPVPIPNVTGNPNYPGAIPGQPQQYPGNTYPQQGIPGLPGQYGAPPAAAPRQPGLSGSSGFPGMGSSASPSGFPSSGQNPGPTPGAATAGQGNSAAGMIMNMLTTPRPGGPPGGAMAGGMGGAAGGIGGGIAGVASTREAEGIMVYNEHTKYNEWEFLYNYSEDQQQAMNTAARGAGVGGNTNPLGGASGNASPFGGNSSFGAGAGSGSSTGQGSTFGPPSQPGGSFGGGGRRQPGSR